MNTRQLRIFELILVLSIAFLPSLIKSLSFVFTGCIIDYTHLSYLDYVIYITQGVLSIALLFYVLFKNNRNYTDIGLKLKFDWKDLMIGLGLMFFAAFANAILAGLINIVSPDFFRNMANPQNIGFLKTNSIGFLLIIVILIPIVEELIVRGFAMTEIFHLTESKTVAVILSVMIQFSYHLYQGIAPALMLIPIFVVFSIYFVKTGNLNPVIISHILIDIYAVLIKR
jgi:membrane protease YdiL (CAAX protease family)